MKVDRGKKKYVSKRWLFIILSLFMASVGLAALYAALLGPGVVDEDPGMRGIFAFVGFIFTAGGFISAWVSFFRSAKYTQVYKVPFDRLEDFGKYDNGLLVVLSGWATLVRHNHEEIYKRGYIKVLFEYDRRGKIITWHTLVD